MDNDQRAHQVQEALEYAEFIWSRYRDHGAAADLKAAIGTYRKILADDAVVATLRREAQVARANLALALLDVHSLTGDARWLDEAVVLSDTALTVEADVAIDNTAASPPVADTSATRVAGASPHAGRLSLLNTRHVALSKRYRITRSPADLAAAEATVDVMAALAPDAALVRMNLGNQAMLRFDASGALEARDSAVDHYQRAARAASTADRPQALGALAGALVERHSLHHSSDDLARAEAAEIAILAALPAGSPLHAEHSLVLGNILLARFEAGGDVEALDAAIETYDRPQSPHHAVSRDRLQNVGYARLLRWRRRHDVRDLELAVLACREAITGPDDKTAPQPTPGRLTNLALALVERWGLRREVADLELARQSFRAAVAGGLASQPRIALHAAVDWGALESETGHWGAAHEAYQGGIAALQALFEAGVGGDAQQVWLYEGRGIGPRAAYAAVMAGDPLAAVLAIERTRAVAWTRALRLDGADLARLGALDGALAERYVAAATRRRRGSPLEEADAGRELAEVIAAVRELPGFEQWLAQTTAAELEAAIGDAPVVYLAAADMGGVALIVTRRGEGVDVQPCWLPELTDKAVRERLRGPDGDPALGGYLAAYQTWLEADDAEDAAATCAWADTLDRLMRWYWDAVMGPLLDALPAATDRVLLVVPGALGFLPLHAAWTEDAGRPSGRRYALDSVSFSYAPNAVAAASAERAAERCETLAQTLLAIENPQLATARDLPCAAFEVHCAASRFSAVTRLRGAEATPERVVAELPEAWLVHFCCHGEATTQNPLASALQLADERSLTLQTLLDMRLARCRLVLLSACETAVIGTRLVDEAISLQGALLQAGAAAAIATGWAVYDTSAALVVARFYAEWRGSEEVAAPRALQRAQQWVRDSTNAEKLAWLECDPEAAALAPLLRDELQHAVRDGGPTGRAHSALLHWAGFSYAGA